MSGVTCCTLTYTIHIASLAHVVRHIVWNQKDDDGEEKPTVVSSKAEAMMAEEDGR